jgi:hypothetical protein
MLNLLSEAIATFENSNEEIVPNESWTFEEMLRYQLVNETEEDINWEAKTQHKNEKTHKVNVESETKKQNNDENSDFVHGSTLSKIDFTHFERPIRSVLSSKIPNTQSEISRNATRRERNAKRRKHSAPVTIDDGNTSWSPNSDDDIPCSEESRQMVVSHLERPIGSVSPKIPSTQSEISRNAIRR